MSILDQYVPEHEAYLDANLSRRPTKDEIREVEALVERYGLRNIAVAPRNFGKVRFKERLRASREVLGQVIRKLVE